MSPQSKRWSKFECFEKIVLMTLLVSLPQLSFAQNPVNPNPAAPAPLRMRADTLVNMGPRILPPPIDIKQLPFLPADVTILSAPDLALKEMVKMIRNAQSEIVMSYFTIWPCSVVSKIIFDEIESRKKGLASEGKNLSVKIIFDPINYSNALSLWLSHFHLSDSAQLFVNRGFEVKLYNPRQNVNRSHVKLFVVDGEKAISGSRNIEDISFGILPNLNLTETDLLIEGPAAKQVHDFFYIQWNSPNVLPPRAANNIIDYGGDSALSRERLRTCLQELPQKNDFPKIQEKIEAAISIPTVRCNKVKFITDLPQVYDKSRTLVPVLVEMMKKSKKQILMSNYTFVPDGIMTTGLRQITQNKNLDIQYLTNALLDDVPGDLGILSHRSIESFARSGINFLSTSIHDPLFDWLPVNTPSTKILHSKNFIVDEKDFAVTSLNMDPLSVTMNVESGIFVEDCPEAAAIMVSEFNRLKALGTSMNPGSPYFENYQRTRANQPVIRRVYEGVKAEMMRRFL